jgi:hypothetical protein
LGGARQYALLFCGQSWACSAVNARAGQLQAQKKACRRLGKQKRKKRFMVFSAAEEGKAVWILD